jgi:hypothetical protein
MTYSSEQIIALLDSEIVTLALGLGSMGVFSRVSTFVPFFCPRDRI